MEIKNKKEAVFAAVILGAEIGIAVAIRSYMFYKDGRSYQPSPEESVSMNGDGEPPTGESADLPADDLAETEVPDSPADPAEQGE
jgi:hypothetical protein